MLNCQIDLVGIRSECTVPAVTPVSGYYLEDLPGFSLQKIASFAEDRTGISLMKTALEYGFKYVDEQILSYGANNQFQSKEYNSESQIYPFYGFESGQRVGTNAETFAAIVRQKQAYRMSVLRLDSIYVYPLTSVVGAVFTVSDGITTTNITTDLTANELNVIPADLLLGSMSVSITSDLTGVNLYTAKDYGTALGCSRCGTKKQHPSLQVTAGKSISADLTMVCNQTEMLCFMYTNSPTSLGRAVWLTAGVYMYQQAIQSNRANQSTQHLDTQITAATITEWKTELDLILNRILPNLMTNLQRRDVNCWQCGNWSYQQQVV